MDLEFNLEEDAHMDLYCDVLVRYLLVGSALGECELSRRLEGALDSGDSDRLAAGLRHFESLPDELKTRILEGDPTLQTMIDGPGRAADALDVIEARRPASG
jgi:hypothetical protein